MDPEAAFLETQRNQGETNYVQPSEPAQNAHAFDEDDEEDYDPSALMPEPSFQADEPNDPQPPHPAQSPLRAGSSVQVAIRPASALGGQQSGTPPTVNRQPRTMGGFIVDDEDDDDEGEVPLSSTDRTGAHGLLAVAQSTSTPQRSVSRTSTDVPSSHVPNKNHTQDQGVSDSVSNGVPTAISPVAPIPDSSDPKQDSAQKLQDSSVPATAPGPIPANANTSLPKTRLPNDLVGMWEDRIAQDPRGDTTAWLSLINEYKGRAKFEDARDVYSRFFDVFPAAVDQWVAYVKMEIDNGEFGKTENIFGQALPTVPNVTLYSEYLNYVRRRHPDTSGNNRKIVSSAYEFVLDTIGMDPDAGQIWHDYIDFIRSGPGQLGGQGWEAGHKLDQMRKTFQAAVSTPTNATLKIWKEYDIFEKGLNKVAGPKLLQSRTTSYMTARAAYVQLCQITKELERTTLPKLPPRPGFDGESEYMDQVEKWKQWINWEKGDPLAVKDEDPKTYQNRIFYVYKQALMALRFWPELWCEAAEFSFQSGKESQGDAFLKDGIDANPESCLLAFKQAERRELSTTGDNTKRAQAVRQSYDKLLDTLYGFFETVNKRSELAVTRLEQVPIDNNEEDGGIEWASQIAREEFRKAQIAAVKNGYEVEFHELQNLISSAWIGLMRAMRRILGKGNTHDPNCPGGLRNVFVESRTRGRITSAVYVASAHMEWQCYGDQTAARLFDRGMKLFKTDEYFVVEHLKFLLISRRDETNARSVFETAVSQLTQKPELVHKAKPVFKFFHEYESNFGELSQVKRLEKRMAEMFPEDPQLELFKSRFSSERFDPTIYRVNISPATQSRPKPPPIPISSVEGAIPSQGAAPAQMSTPPLKRQAPSDESDSEQPERKFARGASPLKGAAGRRQQQQQKRNQQRLENLGDFNAGSNGGGRVAPPAPAPLHPAITNFLRDLPAKKHYKSYEFPPDVVFNMVRSVDLTKARVDRPLAQGQHLMMGAGGPGMPPPMTGQVPGQQSYGVQAPPQMQPPQNQPPQNQPPAYYGQQPNYGYGYPH
ncbi:MAG: mRNA 3'-end-processing protein rna14 [Bathelium mastoideum]|nr:MAG: mRNA 3'-end-processing protein rna14 [Bathelium mastoideum]